MDTARFFIVGPTAVGKSEIAAEIAARCGGEILGADAFQIYEGMPILTAKPSANILAKAPHHLIDAVPLARRFDVAQYLAAATRCLAEIAARGKLPIVVGGTGLYVRALTHGLSDLPKANAAVRAGLEKMSIDQMSARFAALDPAGANRIDLKNKRRLIRALEVCELTGQPFSAFREKWDEPSRPMPGVLLIRERNDLYERIDRRAESMLKNGLLNEVKQLQNIGPTAIQAIGLADARACLAGEISEAECITNIQRATRHYAKRQLTWFRRQTKLQTINLTTFPNAEPVIRFILEKIAVVSH